jgi:hypothetical protein
LLDDTRSVSKLYILESISYMESVQKEGKRCNYPMLRDHLKSANRSHPLMTADHKEHDNAPYNHGAECQVNSLSKQKCADILREELGLKSINYDHVCKDGSLVPGLVAQVLEKGQP